MNKISLGSKLHTGPTIMIFAEGTVLRPKSWFSLYNHNSYVPIGDAVEIIRIWQDQGANIIYCTSRKKKQATDIADLLMRNGFVGAFLAYRESKEKYAKIVETIQPDILIEDDCKSIGGAWQMCITHVKPEIKSKILAISVPEFKGIDNLKTDIELLKIIQAVV